jgi:flavin-dependent dehydrogenase
VGLISAPGANIRLLLDNFLNENTFIPLSYQSGQAGMFSPRTKTEISLEGLKIFLVGDAAGQVKVTTVGGSVTGFAGAQAAAYAILENIPYKTTLRRTNREMSIHYFIRSLLDQMSNQDYLVLLRGLSPGVQSFLSRYDRDQMRRNFWKLIFIQPKYIFLGLKLLFRLVLPW